jgi:rhodanese-related sulfurtransferase
MSVQTIAAREVFGLGQAGTPVEIIDVRTPAEFAELHAQGAKLVPLDRLNPAALMAARSGRAAQQPLYLICKVGGRAANACEKFQAAGFANVLSIDGGTAAWEAAGLPVVRGARRVISLERQVRIAAGSLVLTAILLSWLVHPGFLSLAAFVGAGLVFAGVTDWCGMGLLLARMPWNQAQNGETTAIECKPL